jgi:hypothetical protein
MMSREHRIERCRTVKWKNRPTRRCIARRTGRRGRGEGQSDLGSQAPRDRMWPTDANGHTHTHAHICLRITSGGMPWAGMCVAGCEKTEEEGSCCEDASPGLRRWPPCWVKLSVTGAE